MRVWLGMGLGRQLVGQIEQGFGRGVGECLLGDGANIFFLLVNLARCCCFTL